MCEFVDYSRPPCEAHTHTIPCFCSNNTPSGEDARKTACTKLGISGEWKLNQFGGATCYHHPNSVIEGGGIVGSSAICERAAFKGNIAECCNQPGSCWDSKGGTCDPGARSYTGSKCQNYYLTHCSNSNLNTFKELWQEGGVCRTALDQNTLAGDLSFTEQLGDVMMNAFFNKGGVSEYPGELQEMVYDICKDNPLACNRYLKDVLCKDFKRDDLTGMTNTRKFCGCYLPNDEYETSFAELGGLEKECDSICVSSLNIRPVDAQGNALYCTRNVCIIDNVAIDLVNSNVGNISFGQLCGDCGTGNCICVIKDVDLNYLDSKIGGINLEQECGGNERCYQTASDGQVIEVDCEQSIEDKQNEANEKAGVSWYWIALPIFLTLLILFVIVIIIVIVLKK